MNPIVEIRRSHQKLSKQVNGHTAVIVKSIAPNNPNNSRLGVQYWNEAMIKQGECQNTDKTTSKFIAYL